MDNQSKIEKVKTKSKNQEIANLIEQQVQGAVDPFAATFNALWGSPILLSESEHIQQQADINDISKNIQEEKALLTNVDPLKYKLRHDQEQTGTNSNIDRNTHQGETSTIEELVSVQNQTDTFLDVSKNIQDKKVLLTNVDSIEYKFGHDQKQTSINLDMHKNIHQKGTSAIEKSVPVQKQTDVNLDMFENVHVEKQGESLSNQEYFKSNITGLRHVQKQTHVESHIFNSPILKIIKETTNFALIGFITFLNLLYPNGKGNYSINSLARISGMSRTSIRGNLQNLEKLKLIILVENGIYLSSKCQNWLNFNHESQSRHVQNQTSINSSENTDEQRAFEGNDINLDMHKFRHVISSSNNNNNNITTTTTDVSMDSDMSKFIPASPWDRARIKEFTEELFYFGISVKANINELSMQTVNLYNSIVKVRGKEYAAALFLMLLPKVKDNPTGYISSAFKQGAEPTSASITKVKEIWMSLDILSKASTLKEINQQIKNATERDDMEALAKLIQQRMQIKTALQILLWDGTVEALIEKRDLFVESLLKN